MRIYKQKGKKALCDNLDDEQKEHLKIEDKKSKKKKTNQWAITLCRWNRTIEEIWEESEESYEW